MTTAMHPNLYRIARRVSGLILGDRPSSARDDLARAIEIDLAIWRDAQKAEQPATSAA